MMNKQLTEWQQKVDALNQRERILVLATAVVVVLMLLQLLLIDPIAAKRSVINKQIIQLTSQLQQQQAEQQIINAQLEAGVNGQKIKQREQLQLELGHLNKKIAESVVAMIPPEMMAEVLENMLSKTQGLKLLSLENKPVVAVLEQEPQEEEVQPSTSKQAANQSPEQALNKQALYKHGFILRLNGNYMAAIRYFEKLSELPWRFYWDNMRYEVDTYPNAIITLEVHTVSMAQEWIGV